MPSGSNASARNVGAIHRCARRNLNIEGVVIAAEFVFQDWVNVKWLTGLDDWRGAFDGGSWAAVEGLGLRLAATSRSRKTIWMNDLRLLRGWTRVTNYSMEGFAGGRESFRAWSGELPSSCFMISTLVSRVLIISYTVQDLWRLKKSGSIDQISASILLLRLNT